MDISELELSASPSTSLVEIDARQNLVELFRNRPSLCWDILEHLNSAEDATRIIQKFLLGRGDIDDLVALKRTFHAWRSLKDRFAAEKSFEKQNTKVFDQAGWSSLDTLMARMANLQWLAERIEAAVVEENERTNSFVAHMNGDCVTKDIDPSTSSLSVPTSQKGWLIKPQRVLDHC